MEWEEIKKIYDDYDGKVSFETLIHMELRDKEKAKSSDEPKDAN